MTSESLIAKDITEQIIGGFYEVYRQLGYGFLEHVYLLALERELLGRGLRIAREVAVRVHYKGEPLTTQRVDMIVEEKVVVEIKSSSLLPPTAERQTLNYLRATNLEVALLLHFGPMPRFFRLVCSNSFVDRRPSAPSA